MATPLDERLVDLLGLRDLLAPEPRAGRGTPVPVPVEDGLAGMAAEIDRATREWLDAARDGTADD